MNYQISHKNTDHSLNAPLLKTSHKSTCLQWRRCQRFTCRQVDGSFQYWKIMQVPRSTENLSISLSSKLTTLWTQLYVRPTKKDANFSGLWNTSGGLYLCSNKFVHVTISKKKSTVNTKEGAWKSLDLFWSVLCCGVCVCVCVCARVCVCVWVCV